jgi:hypothetical protein
MTKIDKHTPSHSVGQGDTTPADRGARYAYLVAYALRNTLETQRTDWENGAQDRFRLQFEENVLEELAQTDTLDDMNKLLTSYQNMSFVKNDPALASFIEGQAQDVKSYVDTKDKNAYNHWQNVVNSGGTVHTTWVTVNQNGLQEHEEWQTKGHCELEAELYRNAYKQKDAIGAKQEKDGSGAQENVAKQGIASNFQKLKNFLATEQADANVISSILQDGGD